jgi:cellulose synthase/poly-beta-1,6-N-acetylglucosamine synthase-like glycosyltransferase
MELAVWMCFSLVVFHYVGYPLLLFVFSAFSQAKSDFFYLIRRANRRCPFPADYSPRVAVLMSVYNEEAVIRAKVKNLLETDYPSDRLEFLLGLDAPVDSTAELLNQSPSSRLRVFSFETRRGKLAVLCDLAGRTSAEILVFTDANTMLEKKCVSNLVRHFADGRVGVVSGEEIRVVTPGTDPAGESLYWQYESALKILESRLDCSLGGNGAALAIRRSLFRPRKQSIVEDFQIPLEIRFKGYRVVYDPEAVAVEEIAPTFSAQFARRVRISAGNYQTLFANPGCLNPMRGLVTFCFFSHRVLRWFAPFLLLGAFFCSILLATQPDYAVLLAAQSAFYLAAGLGYWLKKSGKPARLLSLPLSFCCMNFALLLGFVRYLNGRQTLTWKPTLRQIRPEMLLDKGSESR